MDKKLIKLSKDDKLAIKSVIPKAIEMGFLVETKNLSTEIQTELWAAPKHYFVAIAPAFKTDSLSTPACCA